MIMIIIMMMMMMMMYRSQWRKLELAMKFINKSKPQDGHDSNNSPSKTSSRWEREYFQ